MKLAKKLIAEIDLKSNRTLSDNETKILHWIFVSGLLNFRTIWEILLPNSSKNSLHRSARRLLKRGLIEPVSVPGLSLPGWRLSRQLLTIYSNEIGLVGCGPYRFIASVERHNEHVRRLSRLIDSSMETLWVAHEPMLRANELANRAVKRDLIDLAVPDLVTAFYSPGRPTRIAWEVELTQKSGARLERIFENRMTSENWDSTIYVTGSGVCCPDLLERSKQAAHTSPKLAYPEDAKPILFVPLENLKTSSFNAEGFSQNGEMSIREFIAEAGKRAVGEAVHA